jgi:carbon storage regulator
MLVITRRKSETITIGDNVRIMVVEISGKEVRIGVDAPKDVRIIRDDAKCRLISTSDKRRDRPSE